MKKQDPPLSVTNPRKAWQQCHSDCLKFSEREELSESHKRDLVHMAHGLMRRLNEANPKDESPALTFESSKLVTFVSRLEPFRDDWSQGTWSVVNAMLFPPTPKRELRLTEAERAFHQEAYEESERFAAMPKPVEVVQKGLF